MKKRLLALICVALLLLGGCAPDMEAIKEQDQIYASFFPIYALAGMIIEDIPDISLKCLVQPQDDCMRLYDLSDWDASVLAYDADVVIIGGMGLESFESALYTFGDVGPAIISAMYGLNLFNSDGSSSIDGNTGHLADPNPYLYMSVPGARRMINVIAPALAALYPEHAAEISSGLEETDNELAILEAETSEICVNAKGGKVIIMNEALIYVALDYGLSVEYRYDRESGTTLYGASLDEALTHFAATDAEVILIEKQAPAELTRALKEAGYTVVLIDTMNSYPSGAAPDLYMDIQRDNARAVAEAFELK